MSHKPNALRRALGLTAATGVLLLSLSGTASANTFTASIDHAFVGDDLNQAIEVLFDDGGTAGSVTLTVSLPSTWTVGSGTDEEDVLRLEELWLPYNGNAYDDLTFNSLSKNGYMFDLPSDPTGDNTALCDASPPFSGGDCAGFQADGDGRYNIHLSFNNNANDSANEWFGPGEAFTATILGSGITAGSFDALSFLGGNSQPSYCAAARVDDGGGLTNQYFGALPATDENCFVTVVSSSSTTTTSGGSTTTSGGSTTTTSGGSTTTSGGSTTTSGGSTTTSGGTTPVPEPGTLALFAFGVAGLGFARRRRVR